MNGAALTSGMGAEEGLADRLSRQLRAGDTVLFGWNAIGDPLVGETMARAGYDAVLMDMQHGFHTTDSILRGAGTLTLADTPALVRIPVGRFDMASRALDFGAQAVVAPMINSAADARAFAASMKYPPTGERSWGPTRSLAVHGYRDHAHYLETANDHTLAIAMVETRPALEALDGILETPGIDGIFVGPSDFSLAWSGGETVNPFLEEMMPAVEDIAARTLAAGKIPGVLAANGIMAKRYGAMGYRLIALSVDGLLIAAGAKAILAEVRD